MNSNELIETEAQLDERLTRPGPALVDFVRTLANPLVILGAGGKMGPTLALLAKRAADAAKHPLEVIAVSRFSDLAVQSWLEAHQIKTIACDLLSASAVEELPDAGAVAFLVGQKFGATQNPATTWAMNTVAPMRVAERYAGTRMVVLSSGNVYPLSEVSRGGSRESDPLTPLGEYANSVVGRERIFEYYSRRNGTAVALMRLFYAVELRYGVLVDIARKVQAGEAIELTSGYFNCIWQGDANEMVLRALGLAQSPAAAWNLCRPEVYSTRAVATRFGELLEKTPRFCGQETPTALLGNPAALGAKLGPPATPLEVMMDLIVHWLKRGGRNLGKPTHFEVRDGKY